MDGPGARVLVFDPGLKDEIEAMVARLPWGPARGLAFDVCEPDVAQAVTTALAADPTRALGVVLADEPAVLVALEAGADEAIVMPRGPDPNTVSAFVDRLVLRGRKRAEYQALRESLAHVERLTALGTLVASVGHEINNPLTAMALSIDVVKRTLAPVLDERTEIGRTATALIDDLAGALDSIAKIVRDLRVFSRADRDEPPEPTDVPGLVDQALRLVSRELSHVVVERDYDVDLPRLVVPRNRIAQVLVNVLVNAAQATRDIERPSHRVRVSVRADEESVAIAVSDTGPGIRPEHVGRIFDPFFTTKRGELGTGLGLSISRAIVRGLGGDLTAESVYGDGATFLCILPRPTPEALAKSARRAEVLPGKPRGEVGRSILVVEDDERLVRSYVRLLSPIHRVVTAADGAAALEVLDAGFSPDVIVLEIGVAGGDGPSLLAELARRSPDRSGSVLVVTSAASREEYAVFLRDHEGPVLHKPVRGDTLLAAIELLAWGGE